MHTDHWTDPNDHKHWMLAPIEVEFASVTKDWFPTASNYDNDPIVTYTVEIKPLSLFVKGSDLESHTFTVTKFKSTTDGIIAYGKVVTKSGNLSKADTYNHHIEYIDVVPPVVGEWLTRMKEGELQ